VCRYCICWHMEYVGSMSKESANVDLYFLLAKYLLLGKKISLIGLDADILP